MALEHERLGPTPRRFGVGSLILVPLVGLGTGLGLASLFPTRSLSSPVELMGAKKVDVAAAPSAISPNLFVELTKRVKPGVVNISTKKVVKGRGRVFRQFNPPSKERDLFRDFFGEEFFNRFFGETPQRDFVQRSLGSGFIIDKEGHIITNNHVIEGATEIRVRLSTEKEFDAEIIGRDAKTDLALIKIKSWNDLPVVELGDSEKVEIGEWVMGDVEQEVQEAARRQTRGVPSRNLRDVLFANLEHPRWENVAERCLSCGNCTSVCPTCFCHGETDETALDDHQSRHVRQWDSCFTQGHSYIHGMTIRADTRMRYRQWLTHKLGSWHDQYGRSGCVGCGRCIAWCPVGIDITKEAREIGGGGGHG